jgi:hypothetical protein
VAQVIQLSVSGYWEPLVIMRMFVWSTEVSYINSTPFFRLKIVSTNVKTYKCTVTLLYIVFKKGDRIMTLGNDNTGNLSNCVMLCSVSMICIYKFNLLLCISVHLCKCFTIIAVLLCTLQSIRKRLFSGRKPCTLVPYHNYMGLFCTFSN